MSGPDRCFQCASKFGMFKKQHECKQCHRAACKNCLSNSVVIPGLGSVPQPVCKGCYESQSKKAISGRVSPPANFKRELAKKKEIQEQEAATMVDPIDEQITARLHKLKESYERKDISVDEIQERLQKLCAAEPTVTMEELEYRLAKLKGSRPPAIRVHSIRKRPSDDEAHSSKETSEAKQVKRLIRQFTNEVLMEGGTIDDDENFHADVIPENPSTDDLIELARSELKREKEEEDSEMVIDDEMMKRLSQLNDAPTVTEGAAAKVMFNDEGIDEESSKLIRQLMEEDKLEQNLREHGINVVTRSSRSLMKGGNSFTRQGEEESSADEEFPWCFMCNDDATIRCLTCEDLFCKTCFRVVHRDSDMRNHKTEKFVGKKSEDS